MQIMASTMLVQALYLASFGVRAATSGNLAACLKLLVRIATPSVLAIQHLTTPT